ncbi:cytochrome c2 [Roseibium sp. TrichSKD4]|uniref:c-type cytochrome n=1 Tax=Roseibium sp. TrichSKD4 TaxID=744980 RepID=UPI0001E57628|nr:c-type cytochrome [Roseibium sp. TrichSKD4]EFO29425.1 cytochrome c2 [Roseibium sp. TrichSKD4]
MRLGAWTETVSRKVADIRFSELQIRTQNLLHVLTVTAAVGLTGNAASASDAERGASVYKKCRACHELGEGAKNGVGPHLDGLFGRTAGTLEGFKYSSALKKKGEEGLVWDETSLDAYLEKPRGFVPGTRMSFLGLKKAEDRADLITYLKQSTEAAPSDEANAPATDARPEIGAAAMALEGDIAYGEYLATECVTCHQTSGRADGIPSIVGWPKDAFIRALFEYKVNLRTNQVMQNMTVNMGNEEIAALAAYYGSLEPQ